MQRPISQHSLAYRQGLVLGLTMAEVMILVIFVALITLGLLWKKERDQHAALKAQIQAQGNLTPLSPTEALLLKLIKDRFNLNSPKTEKEIAQRLDPSQNTISASKAEVTFIEKVRNETAKAKITDIDELWRELTRSAESLTSLRVTAALVPDIANLMKGRDDPKTIRDDLRKALELVSKGQHDWPPIITLTDADGYNFNTGSAELSPAFQKLLRDKIIPQLRDYTKKYRVDVIEIIGHTDEQPIGAKNSNLDKALLGFLNGDGSVEDLTSGDNAGLGLARASSIVRILYANPDLKQFRILPLSAAHLTLPNQRLTKGSPGDVKERRRIEIRLRRYDQK